MGGEFWISRIEDSARDGLKTMPREQKVGGENRS